MKLKIVIGIGALIVGLVGGYGIGYFQYTPKINDLTAQVVGLTEDVTELTTQVTNLTDENS